MKKLFILFTIVLSLYNSLAFSNSCEEIELGESGKNHWKTSLTDGLRGELMSQIDKKDDLFEGISPEFEIDLNDNLDFKLKFGRSVKDNLPLPNNGKISSDDFFTLKVNNELHLELEAKASAEFVSAGGNLGISLTHSSNHFPNQSLSTCQILSRFINQNQEKGKNFMDATCGTRDKLKILKYYDIGVNFVSSKLGWLLGFLSDNEKNKKFAEDPLASFKLHSLLGVPLDSTVFFENNGDLAVGDIIDHTSFYSLKPFAFHLPLVEDISPTYSTYRRVFRTIGFKKEYGNKVTIEVEDTIIHGTSTEVYKLKPKILKVIKLNLGKWAFDKFTQENLLQRFEVDLNKISGRKFFDKILLSAYSQKQRLNKNSILFDIQGHEDAVKAHDSIYTDSEGYDHRLVFKIPGLLSVERRNYEKIDNKIYQGQEYTNGHRLFIDSYENKLNFDIGIFSVSKKDRSHECQLKLNTNRELAITEDTSLNIECNYTNKFANNEDKENVVEFINLILMGDFNEEHRKKLLEADYTDKDLINMFTNLSFNKTLINKILNTADKEIYHEIARLLFGDEALNVFHPKWHSDWDRAKPFRIKSGIKIRKTRTNSNAYKQCSSLLVNLGITQDYDPRYSNFEGDSGNGKGLKGISYDHCYYYFILAKKVVKSIQEVREHIGSTDRLNEVLSLFPDLEESTLMQALFVRLAGGISPENVRYTYIVASPYVDQILADSNGLKYETEKLGLNRSLNTQLSPEFFPRIGKMNFYHNPCDPRVIRVKFKLNYSIEERKGIVGHFSLKEFSFISAPSIFEIKIPFDKLVRTTDGYYNTNILLDEPLNPTESHTMVFELKNKENLRLSRQTRVYLREVDSFFNIETITGSESLLKCPSKICAE